MTNIQKEAVLAMSEEGRSSTRNDIAAENYYSNQAQIRIKSKKSRKNHSKNTQSQIFNQGNSLKPEEFELFVKERIKLRQLKVLESKNLTIDVLPKFADLFRRTDMVTTSKDRSFLMLNREKQMEAEEEGREERATKEHQERFVEELKNEIAKLKDELLASEHQKEEAEHNRLILGQLFDQNLIDKDGNPIQGNQNKRKIALGSLYGKTTMKATVTPKDHLVQAANPKNFENEVTIGHIRIDSNDGSMQINRGNNRSSMMPATNNSTLDNTAVTRAKNDKRSSSINSSYSRKQDKGSSFKVHNDSVVMTEEHKRNETFQITSQEEPLKPTGFKENLPRSKMNNLYLAYGKQSFAEARRSTTKSTKVRPKSTI